MTEVLYQRISPMDEFVMFSSFCSGSLHCLGFGLRLLQAEKRLLAQFAKDLANNTNSSMFNHDLAQHSSVSQSSKLIGCHSRDYTILRGPQMLAL